VSKLPTISSTELIKFLGTLGFTYDHTTGSHHVLKHFDGRHVTVPERREVGKGLFSSILAEVGISRKEFLDYWNG